MALPLQAGIGSQGWASASASSMVALHSQVMSFILGCALLHQGSTALGSLGMSIGSALLGSGALWLHPVALGRDAGSSPLWSVRAGLYSTSTHISI